MTLRSTHTIHDMVKINPQYHHISSGGRMGQWLSSSLGGSYPDFWKSFLPSTQCSWSPVLSALDKRRTLRTGCTGQMPEHISCTPGRTWCHPKFSGLPRSPISSWDRERHWQCRSSCRNLSQIPWVVQLKRHSAKQSCNQGISNQGKDTVSYELR